MNFRSDINGLRAIAVIAVVLFHFNSSWLPGGFIGVDVFFVISGFLMTGIIFRGLENNSFNIFKFYVARANRIIPALAFLCIVLLIFGWFYLTPLDYETLGKHVVSSIGFLSNVVYWSGAGYFDAVSQEKWLLHTWSLSVEWQFYILYPIILISFKHFLSIDSLKKIVVLSAGLGFVFSIFATMKWPGGAYYLLPTRAWEMIFGGVAYIYPISLSTIHKKITELFGITLILISYFFISGDVAWPGHFALLPVTGTYLVIIANRRESIITNNIIFQALGKWSYSIYLWHWPIVVFCYYLGNDDWWYIWMVSSVLIGYLSFRFIESNKFSLKDKWRQLLRVPSFWIFVLTLLLGTLSYQVHIDKYPEGKRYIANIEKEALLFKDYYSVPECNFRRRDNGKINENLDSIDSSCYSSGKEKNILIYGDSHAQHLRPGIEFYYGDREDLGLLQIATFSCGLHKNTVSKNTRGCYLSNKFFRDNIKHIKPNVLIISQRDEYGMVDWNEILDYVFFINNVYIIGPSPIYSDFTKYHLSGVPVNLSEINKTDIFMQNIVNKYPNVSYIPFYSEACNNENCFSNEEYKYLVVDGSHLSRESSKVVIRKILKNKIDLNLGIL